MSPRITVSHIRTVEPGEPGRPGYNLYERHVTQGEKIADIQNYRFFCVELQKFLLEEACLHVSV